MTDTNRLRRVCLVGAGSISWVHAEALKVLGLPINAVVDHNLAARAKLAAAYQIPNSYSSVAEAISSNSFERAHVLVPPDGHSAVALSLLRAGKTVFVEKPLATTLEECDELINTASTAASLGVNQNFIYHPAFVKLRHAATHEALGRIRFINIIYHAPLRQLDSRQFGHWMFREPRNLLLEQAVHPLSQLISLCGDVEVIAALGEEPTRIAPETSLVLSFTASLRGQNAPASLRFAVGEEFPLWQIEVLCEDGVLFADILANRFWTTRRTRWMQPVDDFVIGEATAFAIARDSGRNIIRYGMSTLKLGGRSDSFFLSMRESIASFHHACDNDEVPLSNGRFGRTTIQACESIGAQILPKKGPSIHSALHSRPEAADVAVLGGTGFIGTPLVSRLSAAGLRVSVMARNLANLPAPFSAPGVVLHHGDIRNAADVATAIAGARVVVNLAHGGGGSDWNEIRDAMAGGAETVATESLKAGVPKLIHISSIAALYLGPQQGAIVGATPPDPRATERADYARAKALCEEVLHRLLEDKRIELCILRPGLVVGRGTSPFHSGVGFFNNNQHCIGWNDGRNPLPFVLVEDVAQAIAQACLLQQVRGRSYNLVGDVRPSAREYLLELGKVLHRPLKFHGKSVHGLYLNELAKWSVKRVGGRRAKVPSLHDLLSRGLTAEFDCRDAKADLEWVPVADVAKFYAKAFEAISDR